MFGRDQFAGMAVALTNLKGAFILSINDRPEIRELFGAFHMDEVTLKYTVSPAGATEAKELIVSNRDTKVSLI